jgi:tRNA(Ile)-lysidine synthase TilS/MesJ
MTLTGVAARLAAAIGVSALVALFLAIALPNLPHQKDGSKAALAEFQPFLASVEASQSTTSEPSEKLLQRFMNGVKNQHRLQDLSDAAIKSSLGGSDNVCRPIQYDLGPAEVCDDHSFDYLFV